MLSFHSNVKIVLSTEEMALASTNPYKLQFLPDLKTNVEKAQMFRFDSSARLPWAFSVLIYFA